MLRDLQIWDILLKMMGSYTLVPKCFGRITLTIYAGMIPNRKGMETGHEKNIGIIIRGDGKGL